MQRRDFVKTSVLAATGTVFVNSVLGNMNAVVQSDNLDRLYQGFQNPPVHSRVFVRWWWNGNRLTANEILRELDVMKKAGIGGVEINPIAFPGGAVPEGFDAMTIFNDDWLEMLKIALEGARERGMVCDMIVGSGWPFGGEFLEKDEQTQMVTIETIELEGGQKYSFQGQELLDRVNPNIHSKNKQVYKELLMARLLPKESDVFSEGKDLMGQWADNVLIFDVPKGNYVLYYVVKLTGFMAVINGATGAAGPVLNHYSQPATEAYLSRISDFITGKIGNMGTYIRAMFCDSMELEGANWNDDLPDEFMKRRGYSLLPYLPFVLKKVGHMGNPLAEDYGTKFSEEVVDLIKRVDLDFYHTRIELFRERFIGTFNDWCHRNNVQSRMQAYGRGMHPLEASMEIDIPECETWLSRDIGRDYPDTGLAGRAAKMCNKYVSSGAQLAGKKIVSCEEITNTSMVFMASLESIKIAGDQSNISGVNQSILHGFNYSPLEAPFPGWIRYGTYFNERNTWWPYFRQWADYKARLSYLFQNSSPQADVAILQPLVDLWLKMGPQRDPFPQKWYPDYQNNIWEAINQNGGGCDYISERIIRESTIEGGELRFNTRSYKTVLLPEIETLDIETAQALLNFAKAGGKVVFIGKIPFKSPSYSHKESHDARIKSLVAELLNISGSVAKYPAPQGDVIQWYGKMQKDLGIQSYLVFSKTHKYLSQGSYRSGENTIFMIANTSLSEHISVQAEVNLPNDYYPWIWDTHTGSRLRYPTLGSSNKIQLELPKATSLLIVYTRESNGPEWFGFNYNNEGMELKGSWELELNHMNGDHKKIELDSLVDLIEMEETKNFAGVVQYVKSFHVESDEIRYIDLGDVQGITELSLNGHTLGTRWYGAHIYDVADIIRTGDNNLSIRLTTIVGNYVKSLADNQVAQAWTGYQKNYPMGIIGPVRVV